MSDIPTRLAGRYDLGEVLGRGGMADVRRARDQVLGRDVAIKLLRTSDHVDRTRFDAEARLLAQLSHENVVTVLDAGVEDGTAWLALELVTGDTLADRLGAGAIDAGELAGLGAQVAAALQHAHDRGIVHRDVKPSNVLVDATGRARLTDFGIARLLDDDQAGLTMTGQAIGTAAYIAPEQVSGGAVTTASDVYALGLLLLEGLTGRREYPGPAVEAALARLQRDPTVPVSLPTGWSSLVSATTARDPAARPTAGQVAARLRALGRTPDAPAPPPPPTVAMPTAPTVARIPVAAVAGAAAADATSVLPGATATTVLATGGLPPQPERRRRRGLLVILGAAASVAIVAISSALLMGGGGEQDPGGSPATPGGGAPTSTSTGPDPAVRTTDAPTTSAPTSSAPTSTPTAEATSQAPQPPAGNGNGNGKDKTKEPKAPGGGGKGAGKGAGKP